MSSDDKVTDVLDDVHARLQKYEDTPTDDDGDEDLNPVQVAILAIHEALSDASDRRAAAKALISAVVDGLLSHDRHDEGDADDRPSDL